MKLQLTLKAVYGKPLLYPHCDKSQVFADLFNKLTFSRERLALIEKLGYEIEIINEHIDWREVIR